MVAINNSLPRFQLGKIVIIPGAMSAIAGTDQNRPSSSIAIRAATGATSTRMTSVQMTPRSSMKGT